MEVQEMGLDRAHPAVDAISTGCRQYLPTLGWLNMGTQNGADWKD